MPVRRDIIDGLKPYASDSMLTSRELAKMFSTQADIDKLRETLDIIKGQKDNNLAAKAIYEAGRDTIGVLVKIARFAMV